MSYDVHVGTESFNYTYNGNKIFYDSMPDTKGIRALDGLKGSEAAKVISRSFIELSRIYDKVTPIQGEVGAASFRKLYDPENGWGSTVGAMLFLGRILNACLDNPEAIVEVQ